MQSYASLRPRAMTRGLAGSGDETTTGLGPVRLVSQGLKQKRQVAASGRKTLAKQAWAH